MIDYDIRAEAAGDEDAIRDITKIAFELTSYSDGKEVVVIDALRDASELTLSLVACSEDKVVGQISFSPVTIDAQHNGWFGLGPIAVHPELQGKGIGSRLVTSGLDRMKQQGANGCVLVGDPAYYSRFGFMSDGALKYRKVPTQYVQRLCLNGPDCTGELLYCKSFETAAS